MILDTTFVIDFMMGDKEAYDRMRSMMDAGLPISVTTPTIFELFSGVAQSSKPIREREKIQMILHHQTKWSLDDLSAERAGLIFGDLLKYGKPIEETDALIAGIAIEHNEPVLTRNVKDFSRVPGLKVETY